MKTAILTGFALGLLVVLSSAAYGIQYAVTALDPNDPNPSYASSINNLGEAPVVLGITSFVYEHGRRINLPGSPNGINDKGQICGTRLENSLIQKSTSYIYSSGTITLINGGCFGRSMANAINTYGEVTFGFHAFLYANGYMRDLGTLPNKQSSAASGINNSGVIIGDFPGDNDGFVYANGQMYDAATIVTDKSWTAVQPNAINDRGQIAGFATKADGVYHAVLLTPVDR